MQKIGFELYAPLNTWREFRRDKTDVMAHEVHTQMILASKDITATPTIQFYDRSVDGHALSNRSIAAVTNYEHKPSSMPMQFNESSARKRNQNLVARFSRLS